MITMANEFWLKGRWIQTFSGKQFWPTNPKVEDIDIVDIAHALSMQCRYGGHCRRFYCVAEHSVHVSDALPQELKLWGLLHDASEAYLVDIPRPIKPFLSNYVELEAQLMAAVVKRFGLTDELPMPAAVKEVDNRILFDEREQNMTVPPSAWDFELEPLGIQLKYWDPAMAERVFLDTFDHLTGRSWA